MNEHRWFLGFVAFSCVFVLGAASARASCAHAAPAPDEVVPCPFARVHGDSFRSGFVRRDRCSLYYEIEGSGPALPGVPAFGAGQGGEAIGPGQHGGMKGVPGTAGAHVRNALLGGGFKNGRAVPNG